MKILGIDPGTTRMGVGLVTKVGSTVTAEFWRCIKVVPGSTHAEQLEAIRAELVDIFQTYKPDATVLEKLFFSKNKTTAMHVSEARGVALATAQEFCDSVAEYSPAEIKIAVTGYGLADKKQMQQMVKVLLRLKEIPTPDDAADALAIALCHAYTRKFD